VSGDPTQPGLEAFKLPRTETGLRKDSVANATQVVTLDRSLFSEAVGALPRPLMRRVETGLRLVLGL
jgi:mRNA interferase MazF